MEWGIGPVFTKAGTDQQGVAELTGEGFHAEGSIHLGPQQREGGIRHPAERGLATMQGHPALHHQSGRRGDLQQGPGGPHRLLPGHRAATRPPGEGAVSDEFVQHCPVLREDTAAFIAPEPHGIVSNFNVNTDDYGIEIFSKEDQGTKVRLTMPVNDGCTLGEDHHD